MDYRREIDGLRAVAVLPVVLFHAGFSAFSGGFVGVDIFFVISGYLITTIILEDKERGTFSLINFYERRARRILPALFFVMLCSLPFAWQWLLPDHLIDFSQSLLAVSAFSSNILFWQESGYFATAAELKPLLHTWSLAVEEQYYVLFPLFLMLFWKLRKRWLFSLLVVIAVTSLAVAQWGAYNEPSATFYLLTSRGWELAIGALIAFYLLYKKDHVGFITSNKTASETFSLLGILLIFYSIYTFDKSTPFPSLYTLLPTLGTSLIIIFTTPKTLVGKFLGTRPMVGIGLISYSTYLWHQPLFAFARHRSLTELSVTFVLALSVLSIMFAYLSWRYIEMPFRNKKVLNRNNIFAFATAGSFLFIVLGLIGQINNGWVERMPKDTLFAVEKAKERSPQNKLWFRKGPKLFEEKNLYATSEKFKTYAYLIGDSHAGALAQELMEGLNKSGIGFMASTYPGCIPVLGTYRADLNVGHKADKCVEHNADIYSYIENKQNIEYIVLSARWTLNLEQNRFNNGEGGVEFGTISNLNLIINGEKSLYTGEGRLKKVRDRYVESIEKLLRTGKKIILTYPVPEAGWNVPDYVEKTALVQGVPLKDLSSKQGSTSHDIFKKRNKGTYEVLDLVGEHPNLFRVKPENIFCNSYVKDRCVVQHNGNIFYRDDDHLSFSGAKLVVDEIIRHIIKNDGLHASMREGSPTQNIP